MWVPSVFCLWTAVFIHSCSCWDTLRGIPAEASEIYTQVEDGESRISQKELQPTRAHMNEAIRFTYNKCHFHGTYQKDARHCTKTTGPGTVLIQSRVHGHPWCVFFCYSQIDLDPCSFAPFLRFLLGYCNCHVDFWLQQPIHVAC